MTAAERCANILQDLDDNVGQELLKELRSRFPTSGDPAPGTSSASPKPNVQRFPGDDASGEDLSQQATSTMYDDRKLPSLPRFSGTDTKGESTYQRWRHEVLCLQTAGCPESKLIRAIQKSLFGLAADTLMYLGKQPTLTNILRKFDVLFQASDDSEVAMAQFYSASQKADESLPAWFTRLESLLNADCLKLDSTKRETMLRARFWKGLNSDVLRHGLRHKFDSGLTSVQLLEAARQIQEEDRRSTSVQSHPGQLDKTTQLLQQLSQQMEGLKLRMDKLEQRNTTLVPQQVTSRACQSNSAPHQFSSVPQQATYVPQQFSAGTQRYRSISNSKAQSNFKFRGQCFKCRKSGHKAKDCLNFNVPMLGGHVAPK